MTQSILASIIKTKGYVSCLDANNYCDCCDILGICRQYAEGAFNYERYAAARYNRALELISEEHLLDLLLSI